MARARGTGTLELAIEAMRRGGADKAQARLSESEKTELVVDAGEISLLRATAGIRLELTAYVGGRKGSAALNRLDRAAAETAAADAVAAARSSEPDPANDISPAQPPQSFGYGDRTPDREAMHERLASFLSHVRSCYPYTRLELCAADFTRTKGCFANTNGVQFDSDTGIYDFGAMFTTKQGRKTSSFNYSGASRRRLDSEFQHWGNIEELMRQSAEQLDPGSAGEKFVGEVIITPDCLEEFVGAIDQVYLGDTALITGTSPFNDSLGKAVASHAFTLRSCPVPRAGDRTASPEIQNGYFFTPDGFLARDSVLISDGVLEGFNLSLYGSNKTGKPRSPNAGGCWIVDPGEAPLSEMISSVKRGLLLCRLSGGRPSDNGDFSGVAKNSYLIEGGRIAHPVAETMVAGNLGALLHAISAVSKEWIDFGSRIFPWIKTGGVTISGK